MKNRPLASASPGLALALILALALAAPALRAAEKPQPAPRPPIDRAQTPGRQVRVATIPIGCGGQHDAKLKLALSLLEVAGSQGVDIACLPEEFSGMTAEPVDGPTTRAVGALARKHHMWVVCPIRELAGEEQFNTAVLLDRAGKVAGTYRKVFVFWGEGVNLSRDGVKTFDTDFGRIALLTCFDANYAELWQEAELKGAEMVLWPSAYPGGLALSGHAIVNNYYVVPVGTGHMIDPFGRMVEPLDSPCDKLFIATLDLDLATVHQDFTGEKVARLLREHAGEVELLSDPGKPEGWRVLRALKPGVRVRDLLKQYQIETLREYRHRSRDEINRRRKTGEKV